MTGEQSVGVRVDVDRIRCEGHGLCEERAPRIFHLDDDDELVFEFEGKDIPPELTTTVAAAVAVCPVAALRMTQP